MKNEDAVAFDGHLLVGELNVPQVARLAPQCSVVMVADGLGGHAGGDVASRTALKNLLATSAGCRDVVGWTGAIQKANDALYDLMEDRPSIRGLGTTVVGAMLAPDVLLHFNVGDSRAYRYGDAQLTRLSEDDVPLGTTGPQPGRSNHMITQCLGGQRRRIRVDPHIGQAHPLQPGEALLLCSDGLTDMVAEAAIETALQRVADPAKCVMRLLQLALDAGGGDNVSIIVARAA
jgi:serine/threonine protein phosphatase PrpC